MFFLLLFWNAILDGFKDEEVLVAVLDTGYAGENSRVLEGWDFVDDTKNVTDKNGHGTKITEIILDSTPMQVKILPIKIADYMGNSSEIAASQGIRYAIERGADIIHMSLNMSNLDKDSKLADAMNSAFQAGIEVVVSGGNNAKDVVNVFPANIEDAVVVSAVDSNNMFSDYSNYGSTIDFAAYGSYLGEEGTSYAAARVTAMLADEYISGGNVQSLQSKAIDAGAVGKDDYYGYGILSAADEAAGDAQKESYIGKTENDIGYHILEIDWRKTDADILDKYFVETHKAYVGMYLSRLEKEELEELKKKSEILNSKVLVQDFMLTENKTEYQEVASYEEDFIVNAIKAYQEYEEELSISAEWLMLKNDGHFAVSSNNREDIYYFSITGFSYTVDHMDSPWFPMYSPEKLKITRDTVKKTTDFGAVYVVGLETYLSKVYAFAVSYTNPETGQTIQDNNLYAIDTGVDTGSLAYGLSITLAGYKNQKEGYHTEETDIVQIPYNYEHAYTQYTYADYKEPLIYYFSYYNPENNDTGYSDVPHRVEAQEKNFKKLILTDYNIWYNGTYKAGYDYSDVNEALSLENKLTTYLSSWDKKVIPNVNVYSKESSLTENGFTINVNLQSSLGIQWNNGETSTVAIKNDVPEYNFPLIVNTYTIKYNGNGATSGSMENTTMTYNAEKNLSANGYSREGYLFKGWAIASDGDVVYKEEQSVKNLTLSHNEIVNLYAVWEPMTFIIKFHGNGATGGVMPDMTVQCDKPVTLIKNLFTRSNEHGASVFRGWSTSMDMLNPTYLDEEVITNLNVQSGEVLNLYAVWDDYPWIEAEDLYFTLEEAQSGFITYEELMNHAAAEDREAGGKVLPGVDTEKGTSFIITDYAESVFTQFQQEGSVPQTYQVIDSIGNVYEKVITVYIVDTMTSYEVPDGTIRFINEKYYNETYERGGLEGNSIWKTNLEYVEILQETFKNSRENTPIESFYFTYEEIQQMK